MKFQNEIGKFAFQRLVQRFGIRLESIKAEGFSYDARNYPGVSAQPKPVIFDVGAHIGQSALWYARSFPQAEIFSFEPFQVIFNELRRNVRHCRRVQCLRLALLDRNGEMAAPAIHNLACQTGKAVAPAPGEASERITLRTLDSFAEEHKIGHIDILKTDTEGSDLEVLAGAKQLLATGQISHVLAEATLLENDREHTKLSALSELLAGYSFAFHGIYDPRHSPEDGRLLYCNALFRRTNA